MWLTEYETTIVMRPDIGGEAIEATLDKVRNALTSGGKLLAINHWGKKRLAYEIEKQTRGVYVHTHYLGAGSLVAEVERNLRLSENVLRFLTVRMTENVNPTEREQKDYVKPEYDAAEEFHADASGFGESDDLDDDSDMDNIEADDDESAEEME